MSDVSQQKQLNLALIRRGRILEAVAVAAELFIKNKDWESVIPKVLALIGKATKVSRVYIFEKHLSSKGRLLASQKFEWVAKGISSQINNPLMQNLDVIKAGFKRWINILIQGKPLYGIVKDFPIKEQKFLSTQDIQSIIVFPIFVAKNLWGFIGFDDCISERVWTQIDIDALKTLAGLIGTVIESSQKDKILLESEEKYRGLVNNLNVGIYRSPPKGRFIEINPAIVRILGYNSYDELKNTLVTAIYQNARDRKLFLKKINTYGSVKNEELHLKKKDGTPIIAQVTARAHRNEAGEIDWIDGVIEDITEHKKDQQALYESETKFRTLVENIQDIIILYDGNDNIKYINPACKTLLGFAPEELMKKTADEFHSLIHPDDRKEAEIKLSGVKQGIPCRNIEYRIIAKDGKIKWISHFRTPIIKDNKVLMTIDLIRDITQQKIFALQLQSAKEAAEAANRAKTAFLANMSHELRTPMHSILGFTDILLEKEENNHQERKEFLAIIKKSSDKLLHIINDLLDLSRIETGKVIVESKEFDIVELAKRLKFTYEPKAREKQLQFKLFLARNLPRKLIGDAIKIEQIVTNLLDNALKFTYQGKVELGFRMHEIKKPKQGILEYYVKDTGIGIEPERMKTLFEQYLDSNAYLTRVTPGARLGLAIVKQLVNLMQGEIVVKSKLTKGTKFLIRQPIKFA